MQPPPCYISPCCTLASTPLSHLPVHPFENTCLHLDQHHVCHLPHFHVATCFTHMPCLPCYLPSHLTAFATHGRRVQSLLPALLGFLASGQLPWQLGQRHLPVFYLPCHCLPLLWEEQPTSQTLPSPCPCLPPSLYTSHMAPTNSSINT